MAKERNLDPIWRTNGQNRDTLMILILSKSQKWICVRQMSEGQTRRSGIQIDAVGPIAAFRSCQHVETSFDLHMHNLLRHKSGFKTHIVL